MFGYVKVYQPELKMGEFEQYRGMYCALCRTLKKRYGFVAQLTLSYDMTFLAVLHMALSNDCAGFKNGRCPYNPLKKRLCCQPNTALEFCADAAMLLVFHKTMDTIHDDRFYKRIAARLILPIMRRNRRLAAERLPELDRVIETAMCRQTELETNRIGSVDAAAQPTADMLSALCAAASDEEKQKRVLARFGYCLGRWVYLIDAADDFEDDIKTGSYNPLSQYQTVEAARAGALSSLNASVAECRAAYELLNIRRFNGILRNVLEWGMPYMQKTVLSGNKDARPSRRAGGFSNEQSV